MPAPREDRRFRWRRETDFRPHDLPCEEVYGGGGDVLVMLVDPGQPSHIAFASIALLGAWSASKLIIPPE